MSPRSNIEDKTPIVGTESRKLGVVCVCLSKTIYSVRGHRVKYVRSVDCQRNKGRLRLKTKN